MKTLSHGQVLHPLDFDLGVDVLERHGRRGELHYQAAEDGVDPAEMIAWADTDKAGPSVLGGLR